MRIDTGISEEDRKAITEGLKHLLADTYMLYVKTHGYHWNVTGPMFDSLHNSFMLQYTELWNAVDPIAERIRALGFFAPGTYGEFAKLTSLSEDTAVPKAEEMLKNLVVGHEAVIRTARGVLEAADKASDQATLDLLTRRLDIHEKTAWMLRAILA